MAGKAKVTLNHAQFRALRNDPAVVNDLYARAQRIAAACGPGYEASAQTGRNRARASVITATKESRRDNAKHNTLVKNMGAGGG